LSAHPKQKSEVLQFEHKEVRALRDLGLCRSVVAAGRIGIKFCRRLLQDFERKCS
jgi:hypothetical protein